MEITTKWDEHIALRIVCNTKYPEYAKRVFTRLNIDDFNIKVYREAFKRIQSFFFKRGKLLTWPQILSDHVLSDKAIKTLKVNEDKRKKDYKFDASLRIPKDFEDFEVRLSSLRKKTKLLKLLQFQNDLTDELASSDFTLSQTDEVISKYSKELSKIKESDTEDQELFELSIDSFRKEMKSFYKELNNRFFLPTGYSAFDKVNIGIPSDSYFLLAGKTGTGKSSLALDMAIKMKKAGARVCFVPLEMTTAQMLVRMAANLTKTNITEIVRNFKPNYRKMCKLVLNFCLSKDKSSCFHFFSPRTEDTLEDVLSKLLPHKYDIIIIDYINLLAPMGDKKEEWKSLDMAGRYAKIFATKNKTIVCLLAQLDDDANRVRYSRALSEHASNSWHWVQSREEVAELGYIRVLQKKARNQDPFSFNLAVDLATSSFSDYIQDEEEVPAIQEGL